MLSDPTTRLPPEVMAIIFEHCLPPTPRKASPQRAPLLVAQIDHRWRSIALSLPDLWSSFSVSGSPAMLELWLERSGEWPLSLRICTISDAHHALAERYLAAIIPHTHRWRDMYFDFPSTSQLLLHDWTSRPFPVLERLSVLVTTTGSRRTSRLDLSRAPKLRSLTLHGLAKDFVLCPFGQLTALRLQYLGNVHSAIAMLKLCPRLELFQCRRYGTRTDPMSVSTYTHSSLAHLCVDPETFAHLTLPALSRVKLDLRSPTELWPQWSHATDLLRRLVQRSDCELDWLWLQDDGRIQPRELQDLLSENPIRHLRLDFLRSEQLKLLMPILDLERVAPHLEHLEIWLQDGSGWEFAPALRPLKTRVKRSGRTLKSFKLHLAIEPGVVIPSNIPHQDLRRFRALAEAGLDVLVTASGGDDDHDFVTILSTTTLAGSAWWSADDAYAL